MDLTVPNQQVPRRFSAQGRGLGLVQSQLLARNAAQVPVKQAEIDRARTAIEAELVRADVPKTDATAAAREWSNAVIEQGSTKQEIRHLRDSLDHMRRTSKVIDASLAVADAAYRLDTASEPALDRLADVTIVRDAHMADLQDVQDRIGHLQLNLAMNTYVKNSIANQARPMR